MQSKKDMLSAIELRNEVTVRTDHMHTCSLRFMLPGSTSKLMSIRGSDWMLDRVSRCGRLWACLSVHGPRQNSK